MNILVHENFDLITPFIEEPAEKYIPPPKKTHKKQ